jgi:acyl-CoA synthetase (AMP-forming)/AMP-acid ligase II
MAGPLYDVQTFWELVERRAAESPDRVMLLDERDRRVSFGGFLAWAERTAAGFYELGVREGTPVSWQLPTRMETVVASMALSRLGAVQNPIIPIYRQREVGFLLAETGAEWFLVPGRWRGFDYEGMGVELAARLGRPLRVLVVYDSLPVGDPAVLPPVARMPAAPVEQPVRWIYSTSGTTSDPKGVRHTDATLIAGGIGMVVALDMSLSDVGSIAFPYTHIGGPNYLVTVLAVGFPAVLLETFVPAEAVPVLRRHGATVAGGTTAFYQALLAEQRKQPGEPIAPTLRMLTGGGAPKPPEVFFEVKREMHVPVVHGMAMTEVPMNVMGTPHDTDEQLAYTDGKPVLGAEIKIVDQDGAEVPTGTDGELCVRGPMVCKGYTRPELTAAAFDDDGYFHSGDLAHIRPDGHIVATGRIKDIIIRKGENISAKEIEDLLYQHPAVADVAVIGLPDPARGERVCAVVELAPGQDPLTLDTLTDYCRNAGLMTQKIPEQLVIVPQFPRNATLKILKHQLRRELADTPWP